MKRALSVADLLKEKKETFDFKGPWMEAFGIPEKSGVWFIWGQSGSGKTSFVLQLCKELAQYGRVIYDSLEEGDSLTMKNALIRVGMTDVKRRFLLLNCEKMDELSERLSKRHSADYVVIDSFQYAQLNYRDYIRFKEAHSDKLLIFISHAEGKIPEGRSARSVMYDATLKIWVEGYRAFSKGRFIGNLGYYTIWPERAEQYWGVEKKEENEKEI